MRIFSKILKVSKNKPVVPSGIFPQDEYPEEVSTDEDDDMFGSRKRVKRRFDQMDGDDEEQGGPKSKKNKGILNLKLGHEADL